MNFERGKETKKSIGIGEFRNALEVMAVFFNYQGELFELNKIQFEKVLKEWGSLDYKKREIPSAVIQFPAYSNIETTCASADTFVNFCVSPWDIEFDLVHPEDNGMYRLRARDIMTVQGWEVLTKDHGKITYKGKGYILPKMSEE